MFSPRLSKCIDTLVDIARFVVGPTATRFFAAAHAVTKAKRGPVRTCKRHVHARARQVVLRTSHSMGQALRASEARPARVPAVTRRWSARDRTAAPHYSPHHSLTSARHPTPHLTTHSPQRGTSSLLGSLGAARTCRPRPHGRRRRGRASCRGHNCTWWRAVINRYARRAELSLIRLHVLGVEAHHAEVVVAIRCEAASLWVQNRGSQ
jgi:hypothetical protein